VPSRLAISALVVVGAMFALSPGPPSREQVDPARILDAALDAAHSVGYTAKQDWSYALGGSILTSSVRVDNATKAPPSPLMAAQVRRNYVPLIEGEDTIAGRDTWVLRLKPHKKYRPWRHVWVDKRTSVVLAMREWDSLNRVKRSMKTTSIDFAAAPAPRARRKEPAVPRIAAPADEKMHVARHLPGGYTLMRISGRPTELATYSDGLQSISVLRGFPRVRSRGRTQRELVMDWGQGMVLFRDEVGGSLAIVGDLPVNELRKIAGHSR